MPILLAFGNTITWKSLQASNVSGNDIFDKLFRKGQWYVRSNRKALVPGERLLFYQKRLGFRGCGRLIEVSGVTSEDTGQLNSLGINWFTIRLALADCHEFKHPIALKPLVQDLDFVSNKKFWGQSVQNTPRVISLSDYDKILNAIRPKGASRKSQ